jgi:fatty-acyl-CoA synthase/long-chain acyl-CoA synthetase
LRAFADDRLTDYRRPKSVAFVDELPQTPDGKVDAKVLLEPHRADEDRQIW